jgi:hypothetical protein
MFLMDTLPVFLRVEDVPQNKRNTFLRNVSSQTRRRQISEHTNRPQSFVRNLNSQVSVWSGTVVACVTVGQ